MIQAIDLIGKSYAELKDLLIYEPLEEDGIDIFFKKGLVPQLAKFTIKDDLYLYDFELTDYTIRFIDNFVYDILIKFEIDKSIECTRALSENKDLTFNFFTRDFLREFYDQHSDDIDPEFDTSWVFDIENIEEYEILEFFNEDVKIGSSNFYFLGEILFSWSIRDPKINYDVDKIGRLSELN